MGDIADAMLNGAMCPCGEFVGDGSDGAGFMQYCSPQCERDYGTPTHTFGAVEISNQRRIPCDFEVVDGYCDRRFKTPQARDQHKRDKHGTGP